MAQSTKHGQSPAAAHPAKPDSHPVPDPYPPYRRVYAWVFQAWLVMFLGVICCALVFYLLSYIPR